MHRLPKTLYQPYGDESKPEGLLSKQSKSLMENRTALIRSYLSSRSYLWEMMERHPPSLTLKSNLTSTNSLQDQTPRTFGLSDLSRLRQLFLERGVETSSSRLHDQKQVRQPGCATKRQGISNKALKFLTS
jgi:hypothetical protein